MSFGLEAAGFSSTWNLIDPLIGRIGHRMKTPALPPGSLSDETRPRYKIKNVIFRSLCVLSFDSFILKKKKLAGKQLTTGLNIPNHKVKHVMFWQRNIQKKYNKNKNVCCNMNLRVHIFTSNTINIFCSFLKTSNREMSKLAVMNFISLHPFCIIWKKGLLYITWVNAGLGQLWNELLSFPREQGSTFATRPSQTSLYNLIVCNVYCCSLVINSQRLCQHFSKLLEQTEI